MNDAGAEREIRAIEAALYRAMIAKDFAALERILAPDLVYVHSTAVSESRGEYLDGVIGGRYEYESIASRNVKIVIHGDVAIMNGIVDMSVGAAGQPKGMTHLLFVLVWVKQADTWQLEFRQATRAGQGSP